MKKTILNVALIAIVSFFGVLACTDSEDVVPQEIELNGDYDGNLPDPGDSGEVIGGNG